MNLLRRIGSSLWEAISAGACFLLTGAGIGYLQGFVSFRGDLFLSEEAGIVGGIGGLFTGWVLYYGVFRLGKRLLSVDFFARIVSLSALVAVLLGGISAFLLQELGWILSVVTPLAAVALTLWHLEESKSEQATNNVWLVASFATLGGGMGVTQSIFAFTRYGPERHFQVGWAVLGMALGISVLGGIFLVHARSLKSRPSFLRLCGALTIATVLASGASLAMGALTDRTKGWLGLFAAPLAMFVVFRLWESSTPKSQER